MLINAKDSLWAAEDIDAVFDQDPQRVAILQGPVAVRHANVKDEPIKDIMDNITSALIEKLLQRTYGGDASKVPVVDYLGARPAEPPVGSVIAAGVQRSINGNDIVFTIGEVLPKTSDWLEIIAGSQLSWLRAVLTSPTVVQGTAYIDNPIRRVFAPRRGQKVVISTDGISPISISAYGAARSHGEHKPTFKAVEVRYDAATRAIDVDLFEDRRDVSVPLHLKFKYEPSKGYAPIHEIADDRNMRIKQFYWKLWFGDNETLPEIDLRGKLTGPEVTIRAEDVENFCAVVGNQSEAFKSVRTEKPQAPIDFAIVTGWQVSVQDACSKGSNVLSDF